MWRNLRDPIATFLEAGATKTLAFRGVAEDFTMSIFGANAASIKYFLMDFGVLVGNQRWVMIIAGHPRFVSVSIHDRLAPSLLDHCNRSLPFLIALLRP